MSVHDLDLTAAFLDVGHGDAIVIRARDGREVRTIVVDGGGPTHQDDLASYLLSNGITTVDLLVATHIDRNHIAGLLRVVETDGITIGSFWGPGCESAQPSVPGLRFSDERLYQRLFSRVCDRARAGHVLTPVRGMQVPEIFSEIAITVLNPPVPNLQKAPPKDAPAKSPADFLREQNELATVLQIECRGLRILLASDAQGSFWSDVLADPALQRYLDADILKMPFYGLPGSLPPPVAAVVHTAYAVFSIDARGDKQPAGDVVGALRDMRAEVLCTEHAPENTFCANPHCQAANGGQNIVFCRARGEASYSTGAYFCPPKPSWG